jgi:hypothetical protein
MKVVIGITFAVVIGSVVVGNLISVMAKIQAALHTAGM